MINKNNFLIFFAFILFILPDFLKAQNTINLDEQKLDTAVIKKEAINKIHDLERFMNVMADKSNVSEQRSKAVTQAVKLFCSEDNIVQVSSTRSKDVKDVKIRDYFNRTINPQTTGVGGNKCDYLIRKECGAIFFVFQALKVQQQNTSPPNPHRDWFSVTPVNQGIKPLAE